MAAGAIRTQSAASGRSTPGVVQTHQAPTGLHDSSRGGVALSYFVLHNPSVDFTAVDFHNKFKDRKAAHERYVGKSFSISGKVRSVTNSWLIPADWISVGIGEKSSGVLCHFPPDVVYQTECLFPGLEVVIRGDCKGEFMGMPVLSNCKVVGVDLPQTVPNLWRGSK